MKKNQFLFSLLLLIFFIHFAGCDKSNETVTGYDDSEKEFMTLLNESKELFDNEIKAVYEPDLETLKGVKTYNSRKQLTPNWDDAIFVETDVAYLIKIPLFVNASKKVNSVIQYWDNSICKLNLLVDQHTVKSNLVFGKSKIKKNQGWYIENSLESDKTRAKKTSRGGLIVISDKYGNCIDLMSNNRKLLLRSKENKSLEFTSLIINTISGIKQVDFVYTNILKNTEPVLEICSKCGYSYGPTHNSCPNCSNPSGLNWCSKHGAYDNSFTPNGSDPNNSGAVCPSCYYSGGGSSGGGGCVQGDPNCSGSCNACQDRNLEIFYSECGYEEDLSFYPGDECNQFYQCIHSPLYRKYIYTCQEGLVFNFEAQYCDYPENVDCAEG